MRGIDLLPYTFACANMLRHYQRGRGGMADAPDLGSGGETRGGSSPLARTTWLAITR